MSGVIDIACPTCGSTTQVRKVAFGQYRCANCGREFTHEDVLPG
jgi:DNA-directed RNA polymerase subunit RPC12/RpoP